MYYKFEIIYCKYIIYEINIKKIQNAVFNNGNFFKLNNTILKFSNGYLKRLYNKQELQLFSLLYKVGLKVT